MDVNKQGMKTALVAGAILAAAAVALSVAIPILQLLLIPDKPLERGKCGTMKT